MVEINNTCLDFVIEEGDVLHVEMSKTPTGGQVLYVHVNGITRLRAQQSPRSIGKENAPEFKVYKS